MSRGFLLNRHLLRIFMKSSVYLIVMEIDELPRTISKITKDSQSAAEWTNIIIFFFAIFT